MRSECPARLVIGMDFLVFGKRLLKTRGVHAPAVMMRREQGMDISFSGSVHDAMVIDETFPSESLLTDSGWHGWCSCTPRSREVIRRKWERRNGSLKKVSTTS